MATMAAVDLGAQSGRVAVGRFDGERLSVDRGAPVSRTSPVRTGDTLHWDILGLYRRGARRAAGGRARRPDGSTRSASTRGPSTSAWSTGSGRLLGNPVHYRDAPPRRGVESVLERVPARELYERTGIQLMPINTVFELAAHGRGAATRRSTRAETLLLIPDLLHYWLCGARDDGVHERDDDAVLRSRAPATWAADLLERLGIPVAAAAGGGPAGHAARPAARRGRRRDAARRARPSSPSATHDTGSAVAAVPFRAAGSAYISAGTWSLVGLEVPRAADHRRDASRRT